MMMKQRETLRPKEIDMGIKGDILRLSRLYYELLRPFTTVDLGSLHGVARHYSILTAFLEWFQCWFLQRGSVT
jgi:hypothetical protein